MPNPSPPFEKMHAPWVYTTEITAFIITFMYLFKNNNNPIKTEVEEAMSRFVPSLHKICVKLCL